MSNVLITPLMGLPNPVPGVDPGPDYANNIQSSFNILDQHNHSSGSGIQINPGGMNINSNLPFNNNNAITLRSVNFQVQSAVLSSPSDLGCLYVTGVDLYYNDENGNQIQITSGGGVNATSSGISSGSASASFVSSVLTVLAAANTPANIQGASILLGLNSAGTNYLTLSPPASLAGGAYELTLPAIPGANSFLTIDTSGNIGTSSNISASQIAGGSITGSQIVSDVALSGNPAIAGKTPTIAGKFITVSNTNNGAGFGLSIIRGVVNADGSINSGEGFSVTAGGGNYLIGFDTSFADTPAVALSVGTSGYSISTDGINSANFTAITLNSADIATTTPWSFVVVGLKT